MFHVNTEVSSHWLGKNVSMLNIGQRFTASFHFHPIPNAARKRKMRMIVVLMMMMVMMMMMTMMTMGKTLEMIT